MTHTRLGRAISKETPLQVVGTINAYCALQAQQTGFNAIYLSGAGVANAAFGLPDLGITNLENVAEEVDALPQCVTSPFWLILIQDLVPLLLISQEPLKP